MNETKRKATRKAKKKVVEMSTVKKKAVVAKDMEDAAGDFQAGVQNQMVMDRFLQYVSQCVGQKDFKLPSILTGKTLTLTDFSHQSMSKILNAISATIVGLFPQVMQDPNDVTRIEIMRMLDEVIFATQMNELFVVSKTKALKKIVITSFAAIVFRVTYMQKEQALEYLKVVKEHVGVITDKDYAVFSSACFGGSDEKRFKEPRLSLVQGVKDKYNVLFPKVEEKEVDAKS